MDSIEIFEKSQAVLDKLKPGEDPPEKFFKLIESIGVEPPAELQDVPVISPHEDVPPPQKKENPKKVKAKNNKRNAKK